MVLMTSSGSSPQLVLESVASMSSGTVTLSNNAGNVIFGAVTSDTLTNQETIQGAGSIGGSFGILTLVNSGTINANQSAGLTIEATGSGNNNTGTIEATAGMRSENPTSE